MSNYINDDMKATIRFLKTTNKDVNDIAKQFDISVSSVYRCCKDIKIQTLTEENKIVLNEMYDEGYAMTTLANLFNVSFSTVKKYINKPRPAGRRAGALYKGGPK